MLTHTRLIAFDLDDTLAPSKSDTPASVLARFTRLLELLPVAVISGGAFPQFQSQLLTPLEAYIVELHTDPEPLFERLHLLPTCGTRYYRRSAGTWKNVYEELLPFTDRALAAQTLERHARELGLWPHMAWGEVIEDRGSQITFSALGQRAPVEAKTLWDPHGLKKAALRDAVAAELPHLEVRSGGSTSVDVTRSGIDKAFGMQKLAEHTGIALDQMLFIGDRLDPQGNDYPVKELGVPCREVTGWEDTVTVLDELLARA